MCEAKFGPESHIGQRETLGAGTARTSMEMVHH